VFPRLLNDLLDFDIQNSTKNDATMAAGWAIVAAYRLKRTKKIEINEEAEDGESDFDFGSISII
jgi:glycine cleavage system pyridoxal-binding protein P